MRRLSAFLMIAALVAVLVPSAALAGKPPPPAIDSVVVRGTTLWTGNLGCALHMQVTWHGRATYVAISNSQSILDSLRYAPAGKSFATSVFDDVAAASLSETVTWDLWLTDRKYNPISPTFTISETWNASTCPGDYDEIARRPPLPV